MTKYASGWRYSLNPSPLSYPKLQTRDFSLKASQIASALSFEELCVSLAAPSQLQRSGLLICTLRRVGRFGSSMEPLQVCAGGSCSPDQGVKPGPLALGVRSWPWTAWEVLQALSKGIHLPLQASETFHRVPEPMSNSVNAHYVLKLPWWPSW